jgi:hypothetical protein
MLSYLTTASQALGGFMLSNSGFRVKHGDFSNNPGVPRPILQRTRPNGSTDSATSIMLAYRLSAAFSDPGIIQSPE